MGFSPKHGSYQEGRGKGWRDSSLELPLVLHSPFFLRSWLLRGVVTRFASSWAGALRDRTSRAPQRILWGIVHLLVLYMPSFHLPFTASAFPFLTAPLRLAYSISESRTRAGPTYHGDPPDWGPTPLSLFSPPSHLHLSSPHPSASPSFLTAPLRLAVSISESRR